MFKLFQKQDTEPDHKFVMFESLISDMETGTQERMRNEFHRLSPNGQISFEKLFALAYEQGKIEGAEHVQKIVDEHRNRMRRLFG
jgi:hypothetical protein